MNAIEEIRRAQQVHLVDEDGTTVELSLRPPLSGDEIAALERECGAALPDELRSLLGFCSGLGRKFLDFIDFALLMNAVDMRDALPHGLPIAATQIRAFANQLDDRFVIVDLRVAQPGMGFSWGRYGPATEVRRFGDERLFAYAKPKKTGFFARFFAGT